MKKSHEAPKIQLVKIDENTPIKLKTREEYLLLRAILILSEKFDIRLHFFLMQRMSKIWSKFMNGACVNFVAIEDKTTFRVIVGNVKHYKERGVWNSPITLKEWLHLQQINPEIQEEIIKKALYLRIMPE